MQKTEYARICYISSIVGYIQMRNWNCDLRYINIKFIFLQDYEPLGALGLQNQTISRVPEAGAPHAFKVSKFGECPFYFSADDEDTATR